MPWYIHAYHAAWTASVIGVGVLFGPGWALAYLSLIVIIAILLNT